MKKLLLYILLLSPWLAAAQVYPVQVAPQLIPPYSLKLSDYQTTSAEKLFINILLKDVSELGRRVRLKMYIEGQGLNIQTLDFVSGATPIYLDGGINLRLSNLDLRPYFDLNNLVGISPTQYSQPLPDGRYDFSFEVYDFLSGQRLSNKSFTSVFLILNDPPFLNLPSRGDLVTAQSPQNIIFNWTPRHLNATNVQYEFTLKEIWDNGMNPQAAFLASPPLHQTTTYATTLLYGPAETQLLDSKTYAWQVRALVSDGISETSVFRNNGYSEIYSFKYQASCAVPQFVLSEAQNAENVDITWQTSNHLRYAVQYRKKSDENYDWFNAYAYNPKSTLRNLEAGTTYEFRVGGECTMQGGFAYTAVQEFSTPTEESEAYYNCGIMPEIEISNQDPLLNLGVNETFTAGDFPVTVKSVKGEEGRYTGWGYIIVPYLADTKIRVIFDNVAINSDFQLISGIVETEYDPTWGSIADVDQAIEDLVGSKGAIADYDASSIDIKEVLVDANGQIILVDENNVQHPIESKKPVVITDKNGDQWTVNEDGTVTQGKTAAGGKPTSTNTNGINGQGEVTQITSTDVSVTFNPSEVYGTDQLRAQITDSKFTKEYESIPQANGGNYDVLYQAISDVPVNEDVFTATATFSNDKTSEDVVFKTQQGTAIPATWEGNTASFSITRQFSFAKDQILATVKPADSTQNYDIAGKVNVWHINQMEVNVTIVALNDVQLPDEIESLVNIIYEPSGVHFNLHEDRISIDSDVWDVELAQGKLDIGNSKLLTYYTPEEEAIYRYYKSQRTIETEMYYIFVTGSDIITTSESTQGFMPLDSRYGFAFNTNELDRTIAHELGHGVFGLQHPFAQYEITEGSTDLLMDYGKGVSFTHMDWQTIHSPGLQLYPFQKDEDGEYKTSEGSISISINQNDASSFFAKYGFLAGTGAIIDLPATVTKLLYSKESGVLNGFYIGEERYKALFVDNKFIGYLSDTDRADITGVATVEKTAEIVLKRFTIAKSNKSKLGFGAIQELTGGTVYAKCLTTYIWDFSENTANIYDHVKEEVKIDIFASTYIGQYGTECDDNADVAAGIGGQYYRGITRLHKINGKEFSEEELTAIQETADYLSKLLDLKSFAFFTDDTEKYSYLKPFNKNQEGNIKSSFAEEQVRFFYDNELFKVSDFDGEEGDTGYFKHHNQSSEFDIIFSTVDLWKGIPEGYNVNSYDYVKRSSPYQYSFADLGVRTHYKELGSVFYQIIQEMESAGQATPLAQQDVYDQYVACFGTNSAIYAWTSFFANTMTDVVEVGVAYEAVRATTAFLKATKTAKKGWLKKLFDFFRKYIDFTVVDNLITKIDNLNLKSLATSFKTSDNLLIKKTDNVTDQLSVHTFHGNDLTELATIKDNLLTIKRPGVLDESASVVSVEKLADDIEVRGVNGENLNGKIELVTDDSGRGWFRVKQGFDIPEGLASKLGNQISELDNWLVKYADDLTGDVGKLLDDLESSLSSKSVLTVTEDPAGKLLVQCDGEKTYSVFALMKKQNGEYDVVKFEPAYKSSQNPNIDVELSDYKLVPDYSKGSRYYLCQESELGMGQLNIVEIEMTGYRSSRVNQGIVGDFEKANEAANFSGRTPPKINGIQYTWHHMDDFRINSEGKMVCTMQLVRSDAHTAIEGMAHSGSVAQMKAYTGNPNLYPH